MTGFAVVLLFGTAFVAALWTLVESIRPQLPRFAALLRPLHVPAVPPRLTRVTVRAVPARTPPAPSLRAAA